MRKSRLVAVVTTIVVLTGSGAAAASAGPRDRGSAAPSAAGRAAPATPATGETATTAKSAAPGKSAPRGGSAPTTSVQTVAAAQPGGWVANPCDPGFDAPAFALPPWNDATWADEPYYSTIQTADLDGDGTDELIGRGPDGIRAWDFEGDKGQWVPIYPGGNGYFTDDAGWKQPRYYRTIQTGDLDGDGKDEVFGRGVGGVVAYTWAGGSSWTQLPELTALSDDNATNTRVAGPESYYTLQAADVDGDGQDEVIDRWNNFGVNMYKLVDDAWTEIDGIPSWGTTGAYLLPQYYRTLQTADLDGDGSAEAIMMTPDGLDAWEYRGEWSELYNEGTDAFEWALLPEFYLTIQAADLDGDGRDEVIGRGPDGIHAYTRTDGWNNTIETGTWKELPALTDSFASGSGWNQAKYYETVQAADVDGDGSQEVLGRGSTGMQVWSLHQSAKKWVELGASGPFTDAQGFDVARSYVPVLAADIDGFAPLGTGASRTGARAEVIGRGPTGVQTWRWDPKGNVWESPSAAFPDYSGGAEAKAYDAINAKIRSIDGITNPDLKVRDKYGETNATTLTKWSSTISQMSRPSGVTAAAWDEVQAEIEQELLFAQETASGFEDMKALATYLGTLDLGDSTVSLLQDYVEDKENADAELGSLLGAIVKSALAFGGPGGGAAGNLLAAGITVGMDEATRAQYAGFEASVAKVQSTAQSLLEQAGCGLSAGRDAVAADWGMLQVVGALFYVDDWPQVDQADPTISAWTARAWSAWVWQQLSNELDWSLTGCVPDSIYYDSCDWFLSSGANPPWYMVASTASYYDNQSAVAAEQLSSSFRTTMFGSAAPCSGDWTIENCSLGLDPVEVFLSLDGWAYQCTENFPYEPSDATDVQCSALARARSAWLE